MIQNLYGLGDYNFNQVRQFVEEVKDGGEDPTLILYRRPDASEDLEFIGKIPPEEAPFLIPDAFAEPKGGELVRRLSLSQLEAIGAEGDELLKAAIRVNVERLLITRKDDPHI